MLPDVCLPPAISPTIKTPMKSPGQNKKQETEMEKQFTADMKQRSKISGVSFEDWRVVMCGSNDPQEVLDYVSMFMEVS